MPLRRVHTTMRRKRGMETTRTITSVAAGFFIFTSCNQISCVSPLPLHPCLLPSSLFNFIITTNHYHVLVCSVHGWVKKERKRRKVSSFLNPLLCVSGWSVIFRMKDFLSFSLCPLTFTLSRNHSFPFFFFCVHSHTHIFGESIIFICLICPSVQNWKTIKKLTLSHLFLPLWVDKDFLFDQIERKLH